MESNSRGLESWSLAWQDSKGSAEPTPTLPSLALGLGRHLQREPTHGEGGDRPRSVPGPPCSPSHPRSLQEPHSLAATGISVTNDDEAARENRGK